MLRRVSFTVGASVALVVPLAGSAVAGPGGRRPECVLAQDRPCETEFNSAAAYVLGGAAAGIPGGPAGALGGAVGGLIAGGITVASASATSPARTGPGRRDPLLIAPTLATWMRRWAELPTLVGAVDGGEVRVQVRSV